MSYMIGVDVGGTFTDFSIFNTETGNLKHFKHSSTPDDPSRAIVSRILHVLTEDCIKPEQVSYLAHGTTVATNALIEKKGSAWADHYKRVPGSDGNRLAETPLPLRFVKTEAGEPDTGRHEARGGGTDSL